MIHNTQDTHTQPTRLSPSNSSGAREPNALLKLSTPTIDLYHQAPNSVFLKETYKRAFLAAASLLRDGGKLSGKLGLKKCSHVLMNSKKYK